MPLPDDIQRYHAEQTPGDAAICERLARLCDEVLVGAERKVWHRHPVWFLQGELIWRGGFPARPSRVRLGDKAAKPAFSSRLNPIVGYHRLKSGLRLMFWSGQSFETTGLTPEGTFKAAQVFFTTVDDVDDDLVRRWLAESRRVQWDYKNIVKNKGRLSRLDVLG